MGIFSRTTKRLVKDLRVVADHKRDVGEWLPAAKAYRRLHLLRPRRVDFLVQAGNCFKEAGLYAKAIESYSKSFSCSNDPEALFQMADAQRRSGEVEEAYATMERAALAGSTDAASWMESPEWFENGILSASAGLFGPNGREVIWGARSRLDSNNVRGRAWRQTLDRSTHSSARSGGSKLVEGILVHQLGNIPVSVRGRRESGAIGVVAIRLGVLARDPLSSFRIVISGKVLFDAVPELVDDPVFQRYEVNHWLDSAALGVGVHQVMIEAVSAKGRQYKLNHLMYVVDDLPSETLSMSDAFVPSFSQSPNDVEAAVVARPANHRRSLASPILDDPSTIYCQRLDQLGDLSASLDGLRDLRILFPLATIICAVPSRFTAIVESAGLVDRVVSCDLEYDSQNEMRYVRDQEVDKLFAKLSGYTFNLGIDLCPGDETRPILRLCNASYFAGFNPNRHDFLDFGIDVISRDKVNSKSNIAHRRHVKMLVASLAIAMNKTFTPIRRVDLEDTLPTIARPYAVVHAGARHAFNRWSLDKFCDVAKLIVARTELDVVLFIEEADRESEVLTELPAGVRLAPSMSGDEFDKTVSGAALFVGNDSGPKHLAAARGVPSVSVHVNRLNWSEWGQDGLGYIVSKSVPCSGCGLNDIALCTKSVVCLSAISPEDVWLSVSKVLAENNIV